MREYFQCNNSGITQQELVEKSIQDISSFSGDIIKNRSNSLNIYK